MRFCGVIGMSWVLVTGAAKGLGAETCIQLAEKGISSLIHYRYSQKEAESLAALCRTKNVQAEIIQGDFSTTESTLQFVKHLQRDFPEISGLVNNVGAFLIKGPIVTDHQEWIELFQTNLHAPVLLMQHLLPAIKKHKGSIVNIGTVGVEKNAANLYATAYQASKCGLWVATKSFAKELASEGVRVNMVSPGIMENTEDFSHWVDRLPMERPASLQEVAKVVLFLLDSEQGYITGQNIEVAGGFSLG